MTLNDALNQIIDDGIEAARADYSKPRDTLKRDGAIAGLEDCRGKSPEQIRGLLTAAGQKVMEARGVPSPQYGYWRCREAEIEWVLNVLICLMVAQGHPPLGTMTARGNLKAAEIIGVRAALP